MIVLGRDAVVGRWYWVPADCTPFYDPRNYRGFDPSKHTRHSDGRVLVRVVRHTSAVMNPVTDDFNYCYRGNWTLGSSTDMEECTVGVLLPNSATFRFAGNTFSPAPPPATLPRPYTIAAPVVATNAPKVDDRYPHKCPRCGGKAYVGFAEIDCAGGCR